MSDTPNAESVWTEWEQPWTRADGRIPGYVPAPTIEPGMTVALRQRTKPYLPTFAPWWAGLVVAAVEDGVVAFENERIRASLDEYPMATHWAAQIDDSGAGDE